MNGDLPAGLLSQLPEPDEHGLRLSLKSAKIMLPGGHVSWAVVKPVGAEIPSIGDGLLARGGIMLAVADHGRLHESLRFGQRLKLMGSDMESNWGVLREGWGRWQERTVRGDTWTAAMTTAEHLVLAELSKLWKFLTVREMAMESEGCHYWVAYKSGLSEQGEGG